MGGCWLYIVRCADGSIYVGTTGHDDPAKAVVEHNGVGSMIAATFNRRPVKLAFAAHFDESAVAEAIQRRIVGWPVDRLEDLMAGGCEDLLIASIA